MNRKQENGLAFRCLPQLKNKGRRVIVIPCQRDENLVHDAWIVDQGGLAATRTQRLHPGAIGERDRLDGTIRHFSIHNALQASESIDDLQNAHVIIRAVLFDGDHRAMMLGARGKPVQQLRRVLYLEDHDPTMMMLLGHIAQQDTESL